MQRNVHTGFRIAGTLVACVGAIALFLGASVAQAHTLRVVQTRAAVTFDNAKIFATTGLAAPVSLDVLAHQRGRGVTTGDAAGSAMQDRSSVILWDESFSAPRGQQTQDRAIGTGNLQGSTLKTVLP